MSVRIIKNQNLCQYFIRNQPISVHLCPYGSNTAHITGVGPLETSRSREGGVHRPECPRSWILVIYRSERTRRPTRPRVSPHGLVGASTRQLITTPIPGSSTDWSGRGCIRALRRPAEEPPSGVAHYVHRAQSGIRTAPPQRAFSLQD